MEIAFLIGGILIGCIGALTVYNTLKLHKKEQVEEATVDEEQEDREKQFNALMNYRGKA